MTKKATRRSVGKATAHAVERAAYVKMIAKSRRDASAGRLSTHEEVFGMANQAGKKANVVIPVALGEADLAQLKQVAKKRKQSVDTLASAIVRRYVRGRLV